MHPVITLDALNKAHPQSIAQNWAAFSHEPADIRVIILVLLIGAVLVAIGLVRSLFN